MVGLAEVMTARDPMHDSELDAMYERRETFQRLMLHTAPNGEFYILCKLYADTANRILGDIMRRIDGA